MSTGVWRVGRLHLTLAAVAAAAAATSWQGSDYRNNAHTCSKEKNEEETRPTTTKEDEEHPDRSNEKHLGARLPQPGEEAGSIEFHSSSNTSEIRNDNKEARATASAAAKVSDDMLDRNAEILRLIEERRSTPMGEKHKLKEVSKRKKRCTDGHPKNS